MTMLFVFSGLPGSGKTTVARELARQTGAVYLRIDVIEQALRDAAVLAGDVGASGYSVANALALSNFALGASGHRRLREPGQGQPPSLASRGDGSAG